MMTITICSDSEDVCVEPHEAPKGSWQAKYQAADVRVRELVDEHNKQHAARCRAERERDEAKRDLTTTQWSRDALHTQIQRQNEELAALRAELSLARAAADNGDDGTESRASLISRLEDASLTIERLAAERDAARDDVCRSLASWR